MKMSICNFENYIKSHYKCYYMNNVETYYYISKNGRVYSTKTHKFLKPSIGTDGRYQVCLTIEGKSISEKIHIMVYRTYIGDIPEGFTINHIDENFLNNYYKNLEVVSRSDNTIKYLKNHGWKDAFKKKYSDKLIHSICSELKEGIYYRIIAKKYNIPINYMYGLVHYKHRKSIVEQYRPFPTSSYRIKSDRSDDKNKIASLILNGLSNMEICEQLNIDYNNANTKIISKLRKELSCKSPRFFQDEFINTIEKLVTDGYSNSQIIKMLNIDYDKRTSYLFTRIRRRLGLPDFNSNGVSLETQSEIMRLILNGKNNNEIIDIYKFERNTYITNMLGRLRQKVKHMQQGSTTRES